jgi:hypothetical protein
LGCYERFCSHAIVLAFVYSFCGFDVKIFLGNVFPFCIYLFQVENYRVSLDFVCP